MSELENVVLFDRKVKKEKLDLYRERLKKSNYSEERVDFLLTKGLKLKQLFKNGFFEDSELHRGYRDGITKPSLKARALKRRVKNKNARKVRCRQRIKNVR